jgi:hypothetical protein
MRPVDGTAGLLLAVAALQVAPAFADPPMAEAALDCGRIETGHERLACYDRLFRATPDAQPSAPESREAEFGLSEQDRRARERESGAIVVPDEITSTVKRVTGRRPNPLVVELENGQQWRLLEASETPPFRAGERVSIRRGAMGSYFASAEARRAAWRVKRVK